VTSGGSIMLIFSLTNKTDNSHYKIEILLNVSLNTHLCDTTQHARP
jgi:hypothetical protein